MKPSVMLIFCSLAIVSVSPATDITTRPQTKEVLVYLQNARINAVAEVDIVPGTYNIVFEEVSQYLLENSVQVKGYADFTILSVVTKKNYIGETKKDPKLKAVEDSIDTYNLKLDLLRDQISSLDEELAMVKSNRSIGGANSGVSTTELEKAADFFRRRTLDINNMQTQNSIKEKELVMKIAGLNSQLDVLKNQESKVYTEITIAVKSNVAAKAKIDLSYMVGQAGWTPFYDIKSESLSEPLIILSKANVYQSTGEDWKKVKLSLSTGNPNLSNTRPVLNPFTLSFADPRTRNYKIGYEKNMELPASNTMGVFKSQELQSVEIRGARSDGDEYYIDGVKVKGTDKSSAYTANTENTTNNIFDISIPYTIPTDGKEYVVEIQEYKVPAVYTYSSIPKLDNDAFLLANLINWDQTGLLPGVANLFNEGMFVGKSYFETRVTSDTIPISMGREKNIILERKKVKSFTEKIVLGTAKRTTLEFEITLRNKKKDEAEIIIEDQIPLSSAEEVTVELINPGNADYTKETGKLAWTIKLKPSESKTLKFGYIIKYPKRYNISNL